MGGCATKPKTLKSDAVQAPEPALEPVKKEVSAVSEAKEVVVVQEPEKKVEEVVHEGDKVKEIVEDDKVDDQGVKRRSLSNLFKENEKGKEPTETDDTPSEPVKQEPSETVKPKKESETKLPEAEKPETPVEQVTSPTFVDALEKIETEKPIEDTTVTEIKTKETPEEKKTKEAK